MFSSNLDSLGFGPASSAFEAFRYYSPLGDVLVPARITSVLGSQFAIDGGVTGRAELVTESTGASVGDWVAIVPSGDLSIIHAVLPRRTQLVRLATNGRSEVQVVAANVDTFFIVTSANRDANARRLERYLAAIAQSGADAVIAVNKIDLCTPGEADAIMSSLAVVARGAPIIGVSAVTGAGMAGITGRLGPGRTVAFVGMSGVGKSSLVNRLLDVERQSTLAIDENDRGRHATTRRELIVLPDDRGVLIDTPGMRSFGVTDDEGLETAFSDVTSVASGCRFRDCRHAGEPGCAVTQAIEDGALDEDRVASFAKLEREAAAAERRRDPLLARRERQRWKAINVAQRARSKLDPKSSR